MNASTPLLSVRDLQVHYGPALALSGVSLDVPEKSALAVLGANGAGKSTLARALSGLVPPTAGRVEFAGRDITAAAPDAVRRSGLVHLPEGRGVFPGLTVQENLRMALTPAGAERGGAIDRAFTIFPVLGERRRQRAGTLSGGEQQMLSLARALMITPRLVIADELSLGLAPRLVDVVFEGLERARAAGVAIIMIEQFAHRALEFADRCVVLQRGSVAWSGPASGAGEEVLRHYLGEAESA
ncbi:ABC transporter ATP-binding protein [Actinomadura monticuli]|uniref:ABC transporter ATP-binding protein n=1 Tax=Actinomadura monticuli TaxID=3097367 RepID=A0ABV4Q533_9ACTN